MYIMLCRQVGGYKMLKTHFSYFRPTNRKHSDNSVVRKPLNVLEIQCVRFKELEASGE